MWRRGNRRGNATIEFTLVGIPLVFILISTVEMARGMWIYHTLAYSVKEGTRYAIGRGQNSSTKATVSDICKAVAQSGVGLLPADLKLTFTSLSGTSPAYPADSCPNTPWPPGDNSSVIDNQPGQSISIAGYYPFISTIAMFWPGAGQGMQFKNLTCQGPGAVCLPATSQDVMQF